MLNFIATIGFTIYNSQKRFLGDKRMAYIIDEDLKKGMEMLEEGRKEKVSKALELINRSARTGKTKGKSYFVTAEIIRKGVPGIEPNPEESRRYYDASMIYFRNGENDSLDHRYMGDYYYYGYGKEAVDYSRALEYYDLSASEGDDLAKERAKEIRALLARGSGAEIPTLSPETVADSYPSEEPGMVPPVTSEAKKADDVDPVIAKLIDDEQLTIRAIRLLDSATSAEQDKLDGLELAKTAAENGSVRAAVLVGYIYEGDNSLVEQDYELSNQYYSMAVEKGSSNALFRLGILYTDKDAPYYDLEKGHQMIIDSARKGYPLALVYIGDCFRAKVIDTRNLDLAYRYYALAGERGFGLGYHYMAEIDSSRQQLTLAKEHENLAMNNGYDPALGYQDPLFYTLHI